MSLCTDEKRLLTLLKSNPDQGMIELYDRYAAAVYGLILQKVPNTDKACKILFEVFLEFKNQVNISSGSNTNFIQLCRILNQLREKDSEKLFDQGQAL